MGFGAGQVGEERQAHDAVGGVQGLGQGVGVAAQGLDGEGRGVQGLEVEGGGDALGFEAGEQALLQGGGGAHDVVDVRVVDRARGHVGAAQQAAGFERRQGLVVELPVVATALGQLA